MKKLAVFHGRRMHVSLPHYTREPVSFEQIVKKLNPRFLASFEKSGTNALSASKPGTTTSSLGTKTQLKQAFDFLRGCMSLSVGDRLTAEKALEHPYLAGLRDGV
ncbi:hypothetical protein HDU98_000674 [Podochytrium sp. JEL0797]|nr:hypothetical protein HDU98_000674 [Podochytrium sp. JEL0797]